MRPLHLPLLCLLTTGLAYMVRINELGDSITGSPGCWRALLWQKLQNAGITNTHFVGTLAAPGCGFTYDGANDGHGGYLATGIANNNNLPGWLAVSKPDVVTMMLGTNDVWNSIATNTILAAYTTLIGQMRAQNPKMVIMVAQITPMNPTSSPCSTCPAGIIALNAAIPAWAAKITTTQSPVSVVNLWAGYNDSTDTLDGVHPNSSGNTKIANDWFSPMTSAIARFPTGTATTQAAVATNTGSASSTGLLIYSQCGGLGYSGSTTCAAGLTCVYSTAYYSQCLSSSRRN